MADPVCLHGGYIVGMEERLPGDPAEFFSTEGRLVGCNRIKCRDCGAPVRHFDRCRAKAINLDLDEYPKLYEAKDPFQFPEMYRDKDSRVYVCRCAFAKTSSGRSLNTLDIPNWFCAGHPQG